MDDTNPQLHKIALHELTITALLTALLMLLRYLTASILGVSFTAGIIIITAAFLSLRIAILAGICLYLITGITLGFGIWIPVQMLGIAAVAVVAYFIPKNRAALCVYAFLSSFMYSIIMLLSALSFVPLEGIPAYIVAGLPNDAIHAVTTVATVIVLYQKSLLKLFQNYKQTYLKP